MPASDGAERATGVISVDSRVTDSGTEAPELRKTTRLRPARRQLRRLWFDDAEVSSLSRRESRTLAAWLAPDRLKLFFFITAFVALISYAIAGYLHVAHPEELTANSAPNVYQTWFTVITYIAAVGGFLVYFALLLMFFRSADRDRILGLSVRALIKAATNQPITFLAQRRELARIVRTVRRRAKRAGITSEASSDEIFKIINGPRPWSAVADRARALMFHHLKGELLDPEPLIGSRPRWKVILESPLWGQPSTRLVAFLATAAPIIVALIEFLKT